MQCKPPLARSEGAPHPRIVCAWLCYVGRLSLQLAPVIDTLNDRFLPGKYLLYPSWMNDRSESAKWLAPYL